MMKVLPILAITILAIISGCQPSPNVRSVGTAPSWEETPMGKPVKFTVKETFPLFCSDQDQFSIIQIIENGTRTIKLEHSCIGIIGSGVDEFCENGKVIRNYQGDCSDAISCVENYSVNYEFSWDQQEYVLVTEQCNGIAIHREAKRQAPAGKYQVVVNKKVIKEFIIVQTIHKP